MNQIQIRELLQFYEKQLFEQVMPFWLERAIDQEYGGFYTCFTNDGKALLSKDKYVWSQGRFIWVLSKLAELSGDPMYLRLAKPGVEFLEKYCRLPNGNCVFLLSREGMPKEPVPGRGYDTSIYVDCFVIIGFAKYAAISGDLRPLESALQVYDSVINRVQRKDYRTDPYPIPKGYVAHGIPMILLNTSQELVKALRTFKHPREQSVNQLCRGFLQEILSVFFTAAGIVMEMVNPDLQSDDTILGRYINPGHSIEDMWFIIHQAIETGDQVVIDKAVTVIENMFELGWDREFGGLFLYVDKEGGPPRGSDGSFSDNTMIEKLKNDWDNKLWWVHSEALYSTLLGHFLTGRPTLLDLYRKVHDYTFTVYPNPDSQIGEWIQIRDRRGQPVQKVVALPVKDPFHISRNFILIIELLRQWRYGK